MFRLNKHLVGHWKMDEDTNHFVDDDSGYELHGTSSGAAIARGKFSRGRYFSGSGGNIVIPHKQAMDFGLDSFSFTGWIKINDYKYPLTTFAVRQGYGCYYAIGRPGFTPGWDIAHGLPGATNDYTSICIRDEYKKFVFKSIKHDQPGATLLGKWTHYAVVFNRIAKRIFLYINGKRQKASIDITDVRGNINNNKPLNFGTLYGWKTKGTIDDYRMYNIALNDDEIDTIFNDHKV